MSVAAIAQLLSQKIGIDANTIGTRTIARASEVRCAASSAPNLEAYFQLLQSSPQEFDQFVEEIVIPETYFFRDRKLFDFLMSYARSHWLSRTTKVRLLSAPCSTGEEPYSIAIALLEAGLAPEQFTVQAIDISKVAIAKAQKAIYGKNSFRGEPWISQNRHFEQTHEGYKVNESVRNLVQFRQGNLLSMSSTGQTPFDIIFCRNLLIYLEPAACHQLFERLSQWLVPQGLLFVGSSETSKVPGDRFVSLRQPFTFSYQKVQPSVLKVPEQPLKSQIAIQRSPKIETTLKKQQVDRLIVEPSFDRAKQLADAGEVEAAIEHCHLYLERDSINADVYTLLGTLYQAKVSSSKAEEYFRKALYLNPTHYEALMHLALLKEHQGDVMSAKILQQRIEKLQ